MVNLNPNGEAFIYGVLITTEHMLLMEAIMLTVVAVLKNAMLSVTFAMCVMGYLFLFPGKGSVLSCDVAFSKHIL